MPNTKETPTQNPDGDFPKGMVAEIEEVLQATSSLPQGLDIYPPIFDTATMFPLQRKRELAYMMQTAREIAPQVVYEIGSDKAGGLYHWCKCLPTVRRVIACEIRGTPYAEAFEQAFPHINFLWLPQSSYSSDSLAKVTRWLGKDKINCLFIDGDKLEFKRDFDNYLPLMSHPGRIFLHDIQDSQPRFAWMQIIQLYRFHEYIDTSDSVDALVREKQGIPATTPYENWLRHWKGRSCGVGTIYLG